MKPEERLNRYFVGIIRRERQERDWSADWLPERAGLPPGCVSRIESGQIKLLAILDKAESSFPRRLTIEDVIYAVAEACCLSPDDLASASRRPYLGCARAVAAAIVRKTPIFTVSQLARHLKRDPSTLHHSIRWYARTQGSNFQLLIRRAEDILKLL